MRAKRGRERATRGGGGKRLKTGSDAHPLRHSHILPILLLKHCLGSSTESPVASSFASTSFPSLALSQKPPPLSSSLLILPKHIVLFAFHVFKVKVAPGRTFVDVLDVIASGLEVSGGIVGP